MNKTCWFKNLLLATTLLGTHVYGAANGGAGAPAHVDVKEKRTRTVFLSGGLGTSLSDPHYEDDEELKARREDYLSGYVPTCGLVERDKAGELKPRSAGIKVGGNEELPIPHKHHAYIDGKLMKHTTATSDMDIRLFGGPGGATDFISAGEGPKSDRVSLEAFASTREDGDTYRGSRKYPIPVYEDKYTLKSDKKISFDRGHEIDHADTKEIRGLHSTHDADNYTPQNFYYNRNIRRPLVDNIRKEGGTYKEIVIYGTNPESIREGKETVKLPLGFVFLKFINHEISNAYYFPNLIDYESLPEDKVAGSKWKKFAEKFEIDATKVGAVGLFRPTVISKDSITKHLRQVFGHSSLGFRTLSGRLPVIPEGLEPPKEAYAALIRHIALHHLEQAAELEFTSVEYKLALARVLASKMKYAELDVTSEEEILAYRQKYDEALAMKSKELGFSLAEYRDSDDYSFRILANPDVLKKWTQEEIDEKALEIKNPAKRKEFIETMKWAPVADIALAALKEVDALVPCPEEGQDMYDLEEAKYWFERTEAQVAKPGSTIEEKIHLLEAYHDEELGFFTTPEKIKALEDNLEEQAFSLSGIDEKIHLIDYFGIFTSKGQELMAALITQLEKTGTPEEKVKVADHYGKIAESSLSGQSRDWLTKMKKLSEMALSIYEEALPLIGKKDRDEIRRISGCIIKTRKVNNLIDHMTGDN